MGRNFARIEGIISGVNDSSGKADKTEAVDKGLIFENQLPVFKEDSFSGNYV